MQNMARFSVNTILTIILATFLAVSSASEELAICKEANELCGGRTGIQCCGELECILEGDFPDAAGICTPKTKKCPKVGEFCGGIAAIQCCKGLDCEIKDTFPDAGGICKTKTCQKFGEPCGGFRITPLICCEGLRCKLDPIPDVGGICVSIYD